MSGPLNVKHILESFPIESLRSALLQWWCYAKRNFPWRETRDSYKVLVAEVLLHRIRAEQVAPLYESFLQRFPDVESLTQSTPEEIIIYIYYIIEYYCILTISPDWKNLRG